MLKTIHQIRQAFIEDADLQRAYSELCWCVGSRLGADLVCLTSFSAGTLGVWKSDNSEALEQGLQISPEISGYLLSGQPIKLPVYISHGERAQAEAVLLKELSARGSRSYACAPICLGPNKLGKIEVFFNKAHHIFRVEDFYLIESLADVAAYRMYTFPTEEPQIKEISHFGEFENVLAKGDLILLRTDLNQQIVEIKGDTTRVLGVAPEALLNSREVWAKIVHPDDLRKLARNISDNTKSQEFRVEIRVVNQKTSNQRWLLVRALPVFDAKGGFSGWEVCGFDISAKKYIEEELRTQSKRVEALYEVARNLQSNLDPAVVVLHGLRVLIKATGSECGVGLLIDKNTNELELVAAEGVSQAYVEVAAEKLRGKSLLRHVIDTGQGMILQNVQKEKRAAIDLAKMEDLKATVMAPLVFESEVLGAIALFCRKPNRYSYADLHLVQAACSQIALATRQAEVYASEKRQTKSLAALYRLSHELSRFVTPREIVEHAFPIIQEEFSCKRMWMGVLNEQGTHIAGQGGFGPGVRGRIINVQIELELRHDFLDEAVRNKRPVIVKAGTEMECSGLNNLIRRLNLGTFVVVPLVSLGQVVGVLVVEPKVPSAFFAQRKLPLLTRMAGEIGAVILARRFEAKMADADKMRMAGLLASGVAHNFNNLLQAVMGQASLVEVQAPPDSPLRTAAQTILDAAGKGAGLIKQLLSFTLHANQAKSLIDIQEFFADSRDFYASVLGPDVKLEINLEPDVPEIQGDYSQIQQVITNLLINAREATNEREDARVRIEIKKVRLLSGEVHPELPPGVFVRIDLTDNGVGMDAEKLSRCFEPFFTTKNVDLHTGLGFEGSGLGLSSAYSVVKQHNGIISVRSVIGEGTTFSVYLPTFSAWQQEKQDEELLKGQSQLALIFDREDNIGFGLKTMVESFGYVVRLMADRDKVRDFLQAHDKKTSVLVVDMDRTDFNILSFLKLVRAENPDLRIVTMCADAKRWSPRLLEIAEVEVVQKPVNMRSVRQLFSESGPEQLNGLRSQIEVLRETPNQQDASATENSHEDSDKSELPN